MFGLLDILHPDAWATTVLKIETAIAEFTVPADKLTNPFTTYNKLSYTKFVSVTNNLDWSSYFSTIVYPSAIRVNLHA